MKKTNAMSQQGQFDFDLDNLLHPARAFKHPQHIVNDPDLTLNEKRALLASWASDACAVEAAPELRQAPGTPQPVRFDDVMDALRALDRQVRSTTAPRPIYHRVLANRIPGMFGRNSNDRDPSGGGLSLN